MVKPLLENWFTLVNPKDTTKPKFGIRKDILLAASKENKESSPMQYLSKQENWGGVKLRERTYS